MKKPSTKRAQWLAANPLRKFITAKEEWGYVVRLADRLGVSRASLFAWMAGLWQPTLQNLVAIEQETGIVASDWCTWLNNRPKERKQHVSQNA